MARVLIVYGTVEGHTGRIADEMREELIHAGHQVRLLHIRTGTEEMPEDSDSVIVGGPIHMGKHLKPLVEFASTNRLRLDRVKASFFTVCLGALDDSEEGRQVTAEYVQSFCERTGWTPRHTAVFAGRLAWTQYDFFTRLVMKLITRQKGSHDQDVKRDYDYTDYDEVRRFALAAVATAERAAVG